MTGPEHYLAAEQILREVQGGTTYRPERLLAEAQVHATLAQAAAIIELADITGASSDQARSPDLDPAWAGTVYPS